MLQVRPAAVAGMFYPASPSVLRDEVDTMLAEARAAAQGATMPKALVVPHAGYVYSGPIAASAYATLAGGADRIRRVILLGPAHRAYLRGLALPDADAFETPLGVIPLDPEAPARIPWIPRDAAAHLQEHSLEVQLPFLLRALAAPGEAEPGAVGFTLVPLAVGDAAPDEVPRALDALWGGSETLIVVSSDLSHYLPYAEARSIDALTARTIVDLGRSARAPISHEQACGATPVNGLLAVARRRGLRPRQLDLRNSGDTAGPRSRVVGYGAFAFYEEPSHAS